MKRVFANILISLFSLLILTQCDDDITKTAPYIPTEFLKAAPESLYIENKVIKLSTYMWVDMMPSTDPNPKRDYLVITYIETSDSTEFPSSVDADYVYIVYNNEVTSSDLKYDEFYQDDFRIVKRAATEPKWGISINPDVVVRITYKGKKYLLQAKNQVIGAVY
ncbi:MAG: hypothetical protein GXO85_13020 [Chlorobi bacterium]|nr:hypothetical protein [Chlorobiota bacterium]